MLQLLVDTSTWLDLAKKRDGQKWVAAIRVLMHQSELELLVPSLILNEFEGNRANIEQSMTAMLSERFRSLRRHLDDFGGEDQQDALELLDELAHQVPLVGAMTTRNFDEIADLLRRGRTLEPTDVERSAVVQRGLDKRAPFQGSKNSVADAVLIELYASTIRDADLLAEPHGFVTSNSNDFLALHADKRQPRADLAQLFAVDGSSYGLGVEGLDAILAVRFGDEFQALVEESDFKDEPQRLDEIQEAEQEFFDRIWYQRSMSREWKRADSGDQEGLENLRRIAGSARTTGSRRSSVVPTSLVHTTTSSGACSTAISALRWVLESEWDFLDTEPKLVDRAPHRGTLVGRQLDVIRVVMSHRARTGEPVPSRGHPADAAVTAFRRRVDNALTSRDPPPESAEIRPIHVRKVELLRSALAPPRDARPAAVGKRPVTRPGTSGCCYTSRRYPRSELD